MRLNGEFVQYDPNEWHDGYDMTINVGLGTGDKTEQMQQLMMVMQDQMLMMQSGTPLVDPANLFKTRKRLIETLGFKQVGEFYTDPESPEMQQKMANQPPPPPPPEVQKTQMQIEADQQKFQAQSQMEQQKFQAQNEIDQQNAEREALQAQQKWQAEQEMAMRKAELDSQNAIEKAQIDAQARIEVERIRQAAETERVRLQAMQQEQEIISGLRSVAGRLDKLERTDGNQDEAVGTV